MFILHSMRQLFIFFTVYCLCVCSVLAASGRGGVFASEQIAERVSGQPSVLPAHRPKICVVLSGGGARGFAHVGVLKFLESQHIPIDCIAGTSMGAVIGGLYAAGLSADDIERRLSAMPLGQIALDIVPRQQIPQTLRQDDSQYPIAGTFGVNEAGVNLPRGVVEASQFLELLHNWTSHLSPDISFDDLAIPFRAVATDLENGDMVVFDRGPLHMAIRASMAAPGVFSPIEVNGRLLSDGGMVRNLPVDVARSMGADIIIAVNIGTPLQPRDKLKTLLNISKQMVNILTEQNVNAQKKLLTHADVLIEPDLGDITFMDFPRAKEAEAIGFAAAQDMQPRLAVLALDEERYRALLAKRPDPRLVPIVIRFVDVRTSGKIPTEDIRRQLAIPIGSVYDAADINQRMTPLINSRQFDTVRHALVMRDGVYGVEVIADERNWGPHFFRFGLGLSTGFDGENGFQLKLGHRRPWLTDSGLEWRNDMAFGSTYGWYSELRQPLLNRDGMYVAPYANIQLKNRNLYSASDGGETRIAEYQLQEHQIGLDLGVPVGRNGTLGEARFGVFADEYTLRSNLGGLSSSEVDGHLVVVPFPKVRMNDIGLRSRLTVDQLDTMDFPREGYFFENELLVGVARSDSDSTQLVTHNDYRGFQQVTADAIWAKSVSSHSLNLSVRGGARFQSGDPIPGFGMSLGGFQRLSAYQPDQFVGNYMVYGNVTYLLRALKFGLMGESVFFGTSLELGNVGNANSDFTYNRLKKNLTFFVGANTFIGPIHFGIAVAPTGVRNLYLQLGSQ